MHKAKIPCPIHSNQSITAVCLARLCDRRTLCPTCYHVVQSHGKYTIPIDSLNSNDVLERIKEAKERNKEDLKLLQDLDEEINQVCDKVILACITVINQQRNIMKKKLMENNKFSQPEDWDTLAKRIKDAMELVDTSGQDIEEIEKYAKRIAKAEYKIRKEKLASKERRGKMLFFHDEVNTLVKQLQSSISSLENTFTKKFEIEKTIPDFAEEKLHLARQVVTKFETSGHAIEVIKPKGLIAVGDVDGNLSLYDQTQFKLTVRTKAQSSWITNIKYTAVSDLLITASQSQEIRAFKILKKDQIRLIKVIKDSIPTYSLLPIDYQNILMTGGKGPDIKIRDLKTLKLLGVIETGKNHGVGFEMLYIPKHEAVGAHFYNGSLCIYDIKTRGQICSTATGPAQSVNALAYIQAKDVLLTAGAGSIKLWKIKFDEKTIQLSREITFPEGSEGNALIPISSEREIICSLSTNKLYSLGIVDGQMKELKKLEGNSSFIRAVPEKRILIVGLYKNKILIFKY